VTTNEAIAALDKLRDSGDPENAHSRADRILIDLIGKRMTSAQVKQVRSAFDAVPKWYA
jgi:hypothetical protein